VDRAVRSAGGASGDWYGAVRRRCRAVLPACIGAVIFTIGSAAASPAPSYLERMHQRAVETFRQGRFPQAYGQFIELANQGHAASARYALWMCEYGLPLLGKDFDCAPNEIEDWAQVAGIAPPSIRSPRYGLPAPAAPAAGRR